ncbi:MAG: hypothetical protein ACXAEU_14805 [Candidatus Hodarchaeales archaeon]|jgi:hypothetical protein
MSDTKEERKGYVNSAIISGAEPQDVLKLLKKYGNVFIKETTFGDHYIGYLCGEVQYVLMEEVGISLLLTAAKDGDCSLDIAGFGGGSPTGRKDPEKKVVTQVLSELEYFAEQEGWKIKIVEQ